MKRLEQFDVFSLPMREIFYDGSFNCRGEFTLQSVKELADSIQEHGLLFPVVVQPSADAINIPASFSWRLLAGHRRFKAVATFLRWPEVPATIRLGLTEHAAHILNLTENLERKDLNPLEEAIALTRLYPDGATVKQICLDLKKHSRWVDDRHRILTFPPEVQQMIAARRITLLDMQLVGRGETPQEQLKIANAIAEAKHLRGRDKPAALRRAFKARRSKSEINEMVAEMLNRGIDGLAPRVAAWCAGYLSSAELRNDFPSEQSPGS